MAATRLLDYPDASAVGTTDAFVVDGAAGTRSVKAGGLLWKLLDASNSGGESKNSLFRGASLGDTYTAAQKQAVRSGMFSGLFLGDYWERDGIKWRIAGFNFWGGSGIAESTNNGNRPHLAILPDSTLPSAVALHSAANTSGGYVNMDFVKNNLIGAVAATAGGVFGTADSYTSMFEGLSNAANASGAVTSVEWSAKTVFLPSVENLYGYDANSVSGMMSRTTTRIPLLSVAPRFVRAGVGRPYWTRTITSGTSVATVGIRGEITQTSVNSAGNTYARPLVAIG